MIADEAEVIEAYFKRENAPQYLITSVSNIINLARGYRSIPLRNCDVGTAEEQERRYDNYCHAHINQENCCDECPISAAKAQCEFAWAQMPYAEKGGAE